MFILLYVTNKGVHYVFDNAVETTVLHILRIDLMFLSYILVKMTSTQ